MKMQEDEEMHEEKEEGLMQKSETEIKKPSQSLLQKFYRFDIYLTMIVVLTILAAINVQTFGIDKTVPQLVVAVVITVVVEALLDFWKMKKWQYSKSAIITGLFIGSILDPGQQLYVPAIAAIIAILSKTFLRAKMRHFFNPAMFSLFVLSLLPATILGAFVSTGWWSSVNLYATIILGLFIAIKFRRLDLTVSFMLAFILINAFTFLWTTCQQGPELCFLQMLPITLYNAFSHSFLFLFSIAPLLFFTFFMLVEPKTSPFTRRGRVIYGVVAAALFFAVGMILPQLVSQLGAGIDQIAVTLLIGNVIAWIMNWKMI